MEVYRISKLNYSKKLISSGSPNRWNKSGQNVIYAGGSRSLSTLEMVVHRSSIIPSESYEMMIIEINENTDLMHEINISDMPQNWNSLEAYPLLQEIGSQWYEKRETLILKVPSAIIHKEFNYIIHTEHRHFHSHVKLIANEGFFWDKRLF